MTNRKRLTWLEVAVGSVWMEASVSDSEGADKRLEDTGKRRASKNYSNSTKAFYKTEANNRRKQEYIE